MGQPLLAYDRRTRFSSGLSPLYKPYYAELCEELPPEWQPYYGLRSPREQDDLYAMGRTLPGSIVTNAKRWESPHNYGCASDWTLWDASGNPIWMLSTDPRWQIYIDAIKQVGLRSGSTFSNPDYPHNELPLMVSWKQASLQTPGNRMGFVKQNMIS